MIVCQLGLILAERRINKTEPFTQTALAKSTGLSANSISNLVNDHTTRYDARVLDALCHVLDVGVGDLLVYVRDE